MNFLAKASTSFPAAYAHLMLLPLWMSIWTPGPLATAGWQVQGQARGVRAAGSSTSLRIKGRNSELQTKSAKRLYAARARMPPQGPRLWEPPLRDVDRTWAPHRQNVLCVSRLCAVCRGQMGLVCCSSVCTAALICLRFTEAKDLAGAINTWTG